MKLLGLCVATVLASALPGATIAQGREATPPAAAHGVIGVDEAQLTAAFWIARLREPERVLADPAAIAAQNARLLAADPSMHDLRSLPATLTRAQIAAWIGRFADPRTKQLWGEDGKPVPRALLEAIAANRALDAIPATRPARYGLVVRRAALRALPTAVRVFDRADDTDIDRFQESALFPGTPVVIAHESRDGRWRFVLSERYAAWIETDAVAVGSAAQVFDYAAATPFRVITGATVRTVFTPELPALSQLSLDMGVRVPLAAAVPDDAAVNGEHPYTSYVIELPVRGAGGALEIRRALLQKNADSAADSLPLTRANLLRQAFKFLGERYGWGHAFNARDCSGFVSDVYRSMGVAMPRNTRDQSVSPAFAKRLFSDRDTRAAREAAARALQVGDLVYIPGHVMMVIGEIDREPYVIHDTMGISYRRGDGSIARLRLAAVSVSPLLPLLFDGKQTYLERMTSIVRVVPDTAAPDSAKDEPAKP